MHLESSYLTKFQLSSTSGSIISRGLNIAIFRKKQCFPYELKSRGGGGGKFPQIIICVGKTNVFYRKRQFSNGHKNSFIASIVLKFCIMAKFLWIIQI